MGPHSMSSAPHLDNTMQTSTGNNHSIFRDYILSLPFDTQSRLYIQHLFSSAQIYPTAPLRDIYTFCICLNIVYTSIMRGYSHLIIPFSQYMMSNSILNESTVTRSLYNKPLKNTSIDNNININNNNVLYDVSTLLSISNTSEFFSPSSNSSFQLVNMLSPGTQSHYINQLYTLHTSNKLILPSSIYIQAPSLDVYIFLWAIYQCHVLYNMHQLSCNTIQTDNNLAIKGLKRPGHAKLTASRCPPSHQLPQSLGPDVPPLSLSAIPPLHNNDPSPLPPPMLLNASNLPQIHTPPPPPPLPSLESILSQSHSEYMPAMSSLPDVEAYTSLSSQYKDFLYSTLVQITTITNVNPSSNTYNMINTLSYIYNIIKSPKPLSLLLAPLPCQFLPHIPPQIVAIISVIRTMISIHTPESYLAWLSSSQRMLLYDKIIDSVPSSSSSHNGQGGPTSTLKSFSGFLPGFKPLSTTSTSTSTSTSGSTDKVPRQTTPFPRPQKPIQPNIWELRLNKAYNTSSDVMNHMESLVAQKKKAAASTTPSSSTADTTTTTTTTSNNNNNNTNKSQSIHRRHCLFVDISPSLSLWLFDALIESIRSIITLIPVDDCYGINTMEVYLKQCTNSNNATNNNNNTIHKKSHTITLLYHNTSSSLLPPSSLVSSSSSPSPLASLLSPSPSSMHSPSLENFSHISSLLSLPPSLVSSSPLSIYASHLNPCNLLLFTNSCVMPSLQTTHAIQGWFMPYIQSNIIQSILYINTMLSSYIYNYIISLQSSTLSSLLPLSLQSIPPSPSHLITTTTTTTADTTTTTKTTPPVPFFTLTPPSYIGLVSMYSTYIIDTYRSTYPLLSFNHVSQQNCDMNMDNTLSMDSSSCSSSSSTLSSPSSPPSSRALCYNPHIILQQPIDIIFPSTLYALPTYTTLRDCSQAPGGNTITFLQSKIKQYIDDSGIHYDDDDDNNNHTIQDSNNINQSNNNNNNNTINSMNNDCDDSSYNNNNDGDNNNTSNNKHNTIKHYQKQYNSLVSLYNSNNIPLIPSPFLDMPISSHGILSSSSTIRQSIIPSLSSLHNNTNIYNIYNSNNNNSSINQPSTSLSSLSFNDNPLPLLEQLSWTARPLHSTIFKPSPSIDHTLQSTSLYPTGSLGCGSLSLRHSSGAVSNPFSLGGTSIGTSGDNTTISSILGQSLLDSVNTPPMGVKRGHDGTITTHHHHNSSIIPFERQQNFHLGPLSHQHQSLQQPHQQQQQQRPQQQSSSIIQPISTMMSSSDSHQSTMIVATSKSVVSTKKQQLNVLDMMASASFKNNNKSNHNMNSTNSMDIYTTTTVNPNNNKSSIALNTIHDHDLDLDIPQYISPSTGQLNTTTTAPHHHLTSSSTLPHAPPPPHHHHHRRISSLTGPIHKQDSTTIMMISSSQDQHMGINSDSNNNNNNTSSSNSNSGNNNNNNHQPIQLALKTVHLERPLSAQPSPPPSAYPTTTSLRDNSNNNTQFNHHNSSILFSHPTSTTTTTTSGTNLAYNQHNSMSNHSKTSVNTHTHSVAASMSSTVTPPPLSSEIFIMNTLQYNDDDNNNNTNSNNNNNNSITNDEYNRNSLSNLYVYPSTPPRHPNSSVTVADPTPLSTPIPLNIPFLSTPSCPPSIAPSNATMSLRTSGTIAINNINFISSASSSSMNSHHHPLNHIAALAAGAINSSTQHNNAANTASTINSAHHNSTTINRYGKSRLHHNILSTSSNSTANIHSPRLLLGQSGGSLSTSSMSPRSPVRYPSQRNKHNSNDNNHNDHDRHDDDNNNNDDDDDYDDDELRISRQHYPLNMNNTNNNGNDINSTQPFLQPTSMIQHASLPSYQSNTQTQQQQQQQQHQMHNTSHTPPLDTLNNINIMNNHNNSNTNTINHLNSDDYSCFPSMTSMSLVQLNTGGIPSSLQQNPSSIQQNPSTSIASTMAIQTTQRHNNNNNNNNLDTSMTDDNLQVSLLNPSLHSSNNIMSHTIAPPPPPTTTTTTTTATTTTTTSNKNTNKPYRSLLNTDVSLIQSQIPMFLLVDCDRKDKCRQLTLVDMFQTLSIRSKRT